MADADPLRGEYSHALLAAIVEQLVQRDATLRSVLVGTGIRPRAAQVDRFAGLTLEQVVPLKQLAQEYIDHVLGLTGNITRTAELLEIDRRTLHRRLDRSCRRCRARDTG